MTSTVDEARVRARRLFDAAEFDESLKAALEGLSASPDDVELHLAGPNRRVQPSGPAPRLIELGGERDEPLFQFQGRFLQPLRLGR